MIEEYQVEGTKLIVKADLNIQSEDMIICWDDDMPINYRTKHKALDYLSKVACIDDWDDVQELCDKVYEKGYNLCLLYLRHGIHDHFVTDNNTGYVDRGLSGFIFSRDNRKVEKEVEVINRYISGGVFRYEITKNKALGKDPIECVRENPEVKLLLHSHGETHVLKILALTNDERLIVRSDDQKYFMTRPDMLRMIASGEMELIDNEFISEGFGFHKEIPFSEIKVPLDYVEQFRELTKKSDIIK